MRPIFLDVDDVLERHAAQVQAFGGSAAVRDLGLLESAVAQPSSTFGGSFLHEGLAAMAAAYLFHIVKNHPFVDGNKRTGLDAALTFLDVNGVPIDSSADPDLFETTLAVASGRMSKEQLTGVFARLVPETPRS